MRTSGDSERGFTLVELLVSVAILGLIAAAIVTVYMTGTMVTLSGESQREAQQGARGGMLMEEDLRLAGYGYPSTQPRITAASSTSITFWADLTNASTTLTSAVSAGNTTLSVTSAGGIRSGDTIYLINGSQWEALTVSSAGGTAINVTTGVTSSYPQGVQVGRPKAVTYSWDVVSTISKDAGDGTGLQPVFDGVQAFQLRYFDTNDAEILPANLAANLTSIRRIAVTLTAQSGTGQNLRAFALTSSVRPRNL